MSMLILGIILVVMAITIIAMPYHIEMTGLVILGFGVLSLLYYLAKKYKWAKWIKVAIRMIAVMTVLVLVIAMSLIARGGRSQWEEAQTAEYAVILGAQIHGTTPSRTLRERLDQGVALSDKNEDIILVVSGGQGSDEIVTEASVMAAYLESQGVDKARIILEEEAHNTRQNLENSKKLVEEQGISPENPVIITSEFHMARAKYIASTLDMQAIGISSETQTLPLKCNYYLREVFAFVKAFISAHIA